MFKMARKVKCRVKREETAMEMFEKLGYKEYIEERNGTITLINRRSGTYISASCILCYAYIIGPIGKEKVAIDNREIFAMNKLLKEKGWS